MGARTAKLGGIVINLSPISEGDKEGYPLQILGHTYTVKKTRTLNMSEGARAICDTAIHEIVVDENFPESSQSESLLHEIVEALNYHLELDLEHPQIAALTEGLFQVMRVNKLSFTGG